MKNIGLALAGLAIVGCASTQNVAVAPETLSNLEGKSLTLVQRESPSFVAMTSGKGMFAVAGVGAATAAGNKLVKEKDIADPALTIGQSLAQNLSDEHGVVVRGKSAGVADSNDVTEIVEQAKGSDYALDVVTNGWSYMYDGFNFGDFYVGYSSRVRMIDVATAKVISNGFCAYDAKKAGKGPVSHDTLLENDAAYIKRELADATDLCIEQFSANLF